MSQPKPSGSSRRRNPYASVACNHCRRRRCKCDGVQPLCGPCLSSGYQCSWGLDDPEGRPATKQYIEGLRVKIQMLESEIAQLRATEPADSPFEPVHSGPSGAPSPDAPQQVNQDDPHEGASESSHRATTKSESPAPPVHGTPLIYQYIFNIDDSIPTKKQTPEVQSSLACEWNRHLPKDAALSRQEHDTIISRCFIYGPTWLFGLASAPFLRDMLAANTCSSPPPRFQHYSPMLHCALLAYAVAFSDDPQIRAPATRTCFATHAKQWLDNECSHPNPSTFVAFALLSEHHRAMGQKSPGNIYLGMSARVAHNPFTLFDPVLRNWYSWSAFVQDKLMAIENGAPSEMKIPSLSIAISELSANDSATIGAWGEISDQSKVMCFTQSCELMVITTQVIKTSGKLNSVLGAVDISAQFEAWFKALPESLSINERSDPIPPHVLCLHIYYYWATLEFHLLPAEHSHPLEPGSVPKGLVTAAAAIMDLVATFRTQHSLGFLPRNMLQAIHTCGRALLVMRDPEAAGVCVNTLRMLKETWPWADVLADTLAAKVNEEADTLGWF